MLWLGYALALQHGEGLALAALTALALLALLWRSALPRWWRTVWRLRWLLLSLSLVFAWATPGEPLFAGDWSPTQEGLSAAMTHGSRLLALLAAVTLLAATTPVTQLMSGLYVLLQPLRYLGLPPERAVVRLLLTLDYVDDLPTRRSWQDFIAVAEAADTDVPAEAVAAVTLSQQSLPAFDVVLAVALLSLGVWWW